MKKIFFIVLTIILSNFAFAGPRVVGNAGDIYVAQFVNLAEKIISHLGSPNDLPVSAMDLRNTLESIDIKSTDQELRLHGHPVDAINYPNQKKIIFNRGRWDSATGQEKSVLVIHEILSLLGIEGTNYRYSKALAFSGIEFDLQKEFLNAAKDPQTPIGRVFNLKSRGALTPDWNLDPLHDLSVTFLTFDTDAIEQSKSGEALIIKRFHRPYAGGDETSALVVRANFEQIKNQSVKIQLTVLENFINE